MASCDQSPIFITAEALHNTLSFKALIQHFHTTLPSAASTVESPSRQCFPVSPASALLLMPSWSSSPCLPYIGVKLVTYFPNNSNLNLPGVNASYALFSSSTGQTLASMDGTRLTLYRTACISGLASKLLSRNDSKVLIMVGAGALAPYLIRAHLAARPSLERVIVWNRTGRKADDLVQKLKQEELGHGGLCFETHRDLDSVIPLGDIVSCATNSEVPLVKGGKLKAGAHLDLVGSFKETMKECDDEAIRRGKVVVDNEAALHEAGEIVGALRREVIGRGDVGFLVDVIGGDRSGRRGGHEEDITVFKSVGSAVVDLLAAQLVYETYMANNCTIR